MTEHENQGLAPHHTAKKNVINPEIILSVSILLAAIIVGYSMMTAASALNNGLSGLTIQGGSLAGNNLPTAPTGNVPPAPVAPTVQMSDLIQNAAATMGNSDAPIVVVEFSDYQCPFCRKSFEDTIPKLKSEYVDTGKVLFAYKDFPLSFHPMANTYANAARCAGAQNKYWEMHDKIFLEQGKKGQGTVSDLTVDDIKTWGSDLGLNATAFNACVDSDQYSSEIQANFTEGQTSGVSGTPSFFIGKADGTGQLIVGAQPYEVFKQAIDSLQ